MLDSNLVSLEHGVKGAGHLNGSESDTLAATRPAERQHSTEKADHDLSPLRHWT
jgi:hypothetical protein